MMTYVNLENLLGNYFLINLETGYNMNVMGQTTCFVINPVTVNNFAALFNCTPAGGASDIMKAPV